MIVFDIETGPLPDEQLLSAADPFEPPPHPGEFDPDSVRLGNTKDPDKIKDKIDDARKKHMAECDRHEASVKNAKREWFEGIRDKAALSPLTGRILAIGYHSTDSGQTILDIEERSELSLLNRFWFQFGKCCTERRTLVGHNILNFDVPFIMRRSWILGVDVPDVVFERGRYLNSAVFKDTMTLWSCGGRDFVKLDKVSKAFGFEGKTEGVDGGMFADLLKTDRALAERYLTDDLIQTAKVAERMGLL